MFLFTVLGSDIIENTLGSTTNEGGKDVPFFFNGNIKMQNTLNCFKQKFWLFKNCK